MHNTNQQKHFSTNRHIVGIQKSYSAGKKRIQQLFYRSFANMSSDFILNQRFGPRRAKTTKITVFCEKGFSVITFDAVETRHLFCQHHVSLVQPRRMIYNLTSKSHVENLTSGQGHDLPRKGHIAYQSIRMVVLSTSMVFVLAGLYQKLLPKNCW